MDPLQKAQRDLEAAEAATREARRRRDLAIIDRLEAGSSGYALSRELGLSAQYIGQVKARHAAGNLS